MSKAAMIIYWVIHVSVVVTLSVLILLSPHASEWYKDLLTYTLYVCSLVGGLLIVSLIKAGPPRGS